MARVMAPSPRPWRHLLIGADLRRNGSQLETSCQAYAMMDAPADKILRAFVKTGRG